MRTTLDIDVRLLRDAMRRSGARTKTEAVERGLQELINLAKLGYLRTLRGKVALRIDINKARNRREGMGLGCAGRRKSV